MHKRTASPSEGAREQDLSLYAMGALPPEEAAQVERALEASPALRETYDRIAAHLLRYDQLSSAPPPPPLAALTSRLGSQGGVRAQLPAAAPRRAVPAWLAATAALLLLGLGVGLGGGLWPNPAPPVPGAAWLLLNGQGQVQGGEVRAESLVRLRLAERVEIVLAPASLIVAVSPEQVRLLQGLAWFEVAPGPFTVLTPHGSVQVRGTRFEVDLRDGHLRVAVQEGRVQVGDALLGQGQEINQHSVTTRSSPLGTWREQAQVQLRPGSGPDGRDLQLALVNEGFVPLCLTPDLGARLLLLRLEGPTGQVLDLPLDPAAHDAAVVMDGDWLPPGATHKFALRIGSPELPPGTYRCTAFYRPGGRPPSASPTITVEVR